MKRTYSLPVDAMLLLGPTGSGKSPLGDHLALSGLLHRTCHHFDFGAELRSIDARTGSHEVFSPDELAFINGVLDRGLLLENEHFPLAAKILTAYLDRSSFSSSDMLLLNGIPRHSGQARDMAPLASIRALIVLECSPDSVLARLRTNVGGDRAQRSDDQVFLVKQKLKIFQERTSPLIRHFETSGRTIYRITVTEHTSPAESYCRLLSLASANPPVALVAEPPQR
jgi:adenylate kinase family enzyme